MAFDILLSHLCSDTNSRHRLRPAFSDRRERNDDGTKPMLVHERAETGCEGTDRSGQTKIFLSRCAAAARHPSHYVIVISASPLVKTIGKRGHSSYKS